MSAPTWYDVLGVERDATADEVRVAWRAATDRAEPGSGQFRAANEAAETLLDPARRAAYDAGLAPAATRATSPGAVPPSDDVVPAAAPSRSRRRRGREERPAAAAGTTSETAEPTDEEERRPGLVVRAFGRVPTLLLAVLLVLVLALAGVGVWLVGQVRAEARVADAREQAPVAAEQAAEAILSYDYRKLPGDQKRAEGFLANSFRPEFTKNFELLGEQDDGTPGPAVQTKAVVTAQAAGSGVVDVAGDGETARVLVFVNQTSEKQGQDPQVFLNRVTLTMKEQDGRWLVSDIRSY